MPLLTLPNLPNASFLAQYDAIGPSKKIGALIILNGPKLDHALINAVWPADATVTYPVLCADGGANLLYSTTVVQSQGQHPKGGEHRRVPTAIVGDLDSVRDSVLAHYSSLGSAVIKDASQDNNDFEKAFAALSDLCPRLELPVVVVGGHGGRIDQTLGNLNTLYMQSQLFQNVYWLDMHNAVLSLSPGEHHIAVDPSMEGPTCGLIPIGHPVDKISTQGLQWNLTDGQLAFGAGGLVSTSNRVVEPAVMVQTSHPVMWTVELSLPQRYHGQQAQD